MQNLNLKDIWIPIEILTDKRLSDKEKTIYAISIYLITKYILKEFFLMSNQELLEKLKEDMEMRGFLHYTKNSLDFFTVLSILKFKYEKINDSKNE